MKLFLTFLLLILKVFTSYLKNIDNQIFLSESDIGKKLDYTKFNVIWFHTDESSNVNENHTWERLKNAFQQQYQYIEFTKVEYHPVLGINRLAVLSLSERDYSCLLEDSLQGTLEKQPQVYQYENVSIGDFDLLLKFVNKITKFYVDLSTGEKSLLGMKIQEAERVVNENIFELDKILTFHPSQVTKDKFIEYYLLKQIPFVIRGGADEWIEQNKEIMNPEGLRKIMGKQKVHIKASKNGQFEGAENKIQWKDKNNYQQDPPSYVTDKLVDKEKVLVRPLGIDLTLNEVLDSFEAKNKTLTYRNKKGEFQQIVGGNFYIEYLDILSYLPNLKKSLPYLIPNLRFQKNELKNFWLGSGDTNSKLHFDPYDNLMVVLQGNKTFTLISPKHSKDLKEGHLREAIWDLQPTEQDEQVFTLERSKLMESTSMVNTPLDSYDQFKQINVTVEEGDILFVPAWYWHEVKSTKNEESGLSMAINFWYDPVYKKKFPCSNCKREFDSINYEHLLE